MQTRKDDNVFPYQFEEEDGSEIYEPGLTKREYFAAMALQGLLSTSKALPDNAEIIAVKMADELIKALNTQDENSNL